MQGGCLCGAVRYRLLSAPFDAGWCHCRTCQLNSGSPAMAFASVPIGDFVVEQGAAQIGRIASSAFGHRQFCTRCGTPLLMQVDDQPQTVDFSIATLDDPARSRPASISSTPAESLGRAPPTTLRVTTASGVRRAGSTRRKAYSSLWIHCLIPLFGSAPT
ncbi:MAG: GFA family protein [Sphingomonas sp.]